MLCDYRDQLMHERVRLINRLRWHLVRIAPRARGAARPGSAEGPTDPRPARPPARAAAGQPELRVAKAQLRRINEITKEQKELFAELTVLLQAHAPQLLEQPSIGTVTAAVIIGRTAGAKRFRSEACFARHAGTAPIPASSGNTTRHRLHRGGDRQLNRAIHIIALGRMAWRPRHPRLHRTPRHRRQNQTRSDPLPQTPHRQTDLAPALQHPTHHPRHRSTHHQHASQSAAQDSCHAPDETRK